MNAQTESKAFIFVTKTVKWQNCLGDSFHYTDNLFNLKKQFDLTTKYDIKQTFN